MESDHAEAGCVPTTSITDREQQMSDQTYLSWPFFQREHRELAQRARAWAAQLPAHSVSDIDQACRDLVHELGAGGWLRYCVPAAHGGALGTMESRSLCMLRETFAYHSGLLDFAFAMQGLGSGAISLDGSDELRQRYLPAVAQGKSIAAFALSEPEAGSDVGAIATSARKDGTQYVLDGEKTWISNGGIADFYVLFARTGEAPGSRGLSAFVIDADTAGLKASERIEVMAPHPLATLRLENCRVPASHLLGNAGDGFRIAMQTLDVFRASVAAAGLGFARRALDEALEHSTSRKMFGQTLADFQLTQTILAEMATDIDAAALLTYRAAWLRDTQNARTTSAAAMAKLTATENAQRVIDRALQMFGGRGVVRGEIVERLYREIRALRIYEGATEVQKLIIGRELLKQARS
jgi:acyl-CoA dehydrogenase